MYVSLRFDFFFFFFRSRHVSDCKVEQNRDLLPHSVTLMFLFSFSRISLYIYIHNNNNIIVCSFNIIYKLYFHAEYVNF